MGWMARMAGAHHELRRQMGWQATGIRTDSDEAVRISIGRYLELK